MAPILIVLLCALGTLTAFACCTVAGRADDATEAWNKAHNEASYTT